MASIKPRGKSWRAEVCVGGVRRSKTFESKEEAKRWARRLEAAADDGLLIARPGDNDCTLAELIERLESSGPTAPPASPHTQSTGRVHPPPRAR